MNIPLVYQLLLLELVIDGLRLAALSTPNMLSTPLSIFAGLVLGEFSVNSGWFNQRGHAVYGICSGGKLYAAEF